MTRGTHFPEAHVRGKLQGFAAVHAAQRVPGETVATLVVAAAVVVEAFVVVLDGATVVVAQTAKLTEFVAGVKG